MNGNRGLTLVELIISMAIFIVLMGIVTKAFDSIVSFSGQAAKSAESDISGMVGLEILRRDVEHAGFGLLWSYQNIPTDFKEVATAAGFPVQGISGEALNDVPPSDPADLETAAPRAIYAATVPSTVERIIDGTGSYRTNPSTDYLILRSVPVGMNDATRRWGYVNYSGSNSYIKRWGNQDDLKANDFTIALKTTFSSSGSDSRMLAMNATNFQYKVTGGTNEVPGNSAFLPEDKIQKVAMYGVANSSTTGFALKMPYNRADYFIRKPAQAEDFPASCNPGTGVLYKFIAGHGGSSGYSQQLPLLDCVGDMQVMFELDSSGTANLGNISYVETLSGRTAREIREQLRTVRIYLLTHEGKKERSYTFPYSDANKVIIVGDPTNTLIPSSVLRTWTAAEMASHFGSDWRNYRWRVISLVVQPKNLYNQ